MDNETTAPTETATPAAEKPSGKPESLAKAMERIGGESAFDGGYKLDEKPEPAAAADEKPEPEKTARKPKPEPSESAASPTELEQIKALAEKLGLALEDGKVTTTERVNLRKERAENLRAIAQAEKDAIAKVQAARSEWEPKIGKVEAFEAAVKAGDYDAIAKLAGFDDWNKLQDDQIQRLADPNYKRVRELEERLKREDEAKARAKEESDRQQATQAELQAQANHKRQLQSIMGQSSDPLVKGMHDVPNFINAVFNVQRRVWQESGGRDVLTAESAIKWKPPEGGPSLHEELEAMHGRLSPVFSKSTAAPPAAGTPEKPKPKTAPVPPPAASPPSRHASNGFSQSMRDRLAAAINDDIRSGR